ncbi:MAG TPA: IS4 family transposase [Terriglobales bacterium]|nr:IS4 family transposase [Terriglobales bacterium]
MALGSCIRPVFLDLLGRCEEQARRGRRKFRFENKRLSLEATVIDLCASLYDWAKFRRTKGAIKLHLLLDHDGYLPRFAVITDGKTHELSVARKLRWEPGTIVVFDRGYIDYQWFVELTRQGVYWVTRLKDNADYLVVERRPVPTGGKVLADEVISFYGLPGEGREYFFRRVEIWDAEQERRLVFLSNHLQFGPTTLAAIYKERWQVELFFKALKQLCKIKTFVGTSANAVKTQVWTALIAMLLLRFLQLQACFGWPLSNLLALLRQQLFVHRDLWIWLDNPFRPPPPPPEEQLQLALV